MYLPLTHLGGVVLHPVSLVEGGVVAEFVCINSSSILFIPTPSPPVNAIE